MKNITCFRAIADSRRMKIDGLILAGGFSQRMGSNKALLEIDQLPLIQHLLNQIEPVVSQVYITASHNQQAIQQAIDGNPIFLHDFYQSNEGPLSGIASTLMTSTADLLWVNSVDSYGQVAILKPLMLDALEAQGSDIVFLYIQNNYQPLQALIKTSLKTSIKTYLEQGHRGVLKWYMSQNHSMIKINDSKNLWPNINTPDDFNRLTYELNKRFD